jgi:nucleoside-diphosphate-sugar epimerase
VRQRIAITGATGFVGRNVIPALQSAGHDVVPLNRAANGPGSRAYDFSMPVAELRTALKGCTSVLHLAARVHVLAEANDQSTIEACLAANCAATARLAEAAAAEGIGHFIYLSTAKVYGEKSHDLPFTVGRPEAPQGPYAISKWRAEQTLQDLAGRAGFALSIIRPPLIHGPGVKANLQALARIARSPIPLPFGAIQNRRSLLGTTNLASLLKALLLRSDKAPLTLNASDGEDVSTTKLVQLLAEAHGQRAKLLPVPQILLRAILSAVGRTDLVGRLLDDFQIDIAATTRALDWRPSVSLAESLKEAFSTDGSER